LSDVFVGTTCSLYTCAAVFFNLFAAAEPYTSVKVTYGTPCMMHWSVSPATYVRLKLQGVYGLIFLAEQTPCEDDKASKNDQY